MLLAGKGQLNESHVMYIYMFYIYNSNNNGYIVFLTPEHVFLTSCLFFDLLTCSPDLLTCFFDPPVGPHLRSLFLNS